MKNYNEILDSTPLHRILEEVMQAEKNIDGNPNKWKTDYSDILVKDNSWYTFTGGYHGTGAISLVTHHLTLTSYQPDIQARTINILLKMNEKLVLKEELDNSLSQQKNISKRKL